MTTLANSPSLRPLPGEPIWLQNVNISGQKHFHDHIALRLFGFALLHPLYRFIISVAIPRSKEKMQLCTKPDGSFVQCKRTGTASSATLGQQLHMPFYCFSSTTPGVIQRIATQGTSGRQFSLSVWRGFLFCGWVEKHSQNLRAFLGQR